MPKLRVLDFQDNRAPDDQGRHLRDMLCWPDDRLEFAHDYIQWMFPLREPSAVNPFAPILDDQTVEAFRARRDLQQNLRESFLRMLRFYGLALEQGSVVRGANFAERSRNWLRPDNHNHLRITRILKCLRVLGLEAEARAFFGCLVEIRSAAPDKITEETFEYWKAAAGR